jgi:hypothetical protein
MRSYFTLIGLNCFFIEALQSRYVWNGLPLWSARPHVLVLILAFSVSLTSTVQYSKYRFVKPRHKTKTTYASQSQSLPALTASLLHTSFPHYLSSFSVLGQHLPTQSRQPLACGSRTRTFFKISFLFLLCTLTLSLFNSLHRRPRGRLYDTRHRHC